MKNLNELQNIVKDLNEISKRFKSSPNYIEFKKYWSDAVYYNKLQKQCQSGDVVKSILLYDETTKKTEWFTISTAKIYTRKEWFKINFAADVLYFTYQEIKHLLN